MLILIYRVKINFDGASLEYKLTTASSKVEIVLYLKIFFTQIIILYYKSFFLINKK